MNKERLPLLGSSESSIQDLESTPSQRRLSPAFIVLIIFLILDWAATATLAFLYVHELDHSEVSEDSNQFYYAFLSEWLVVGAIGLGIISNFLIAFTSRSCEDPYCSCFDYSCCVAAYFCSTGLLTFAAITLPIAPGVLLTINAAKYASKILPAFAAATSFLMSFLGLLIVCITFCRVHQSD